MKKRINKGHFPKQLTQTEMEEAFNEEMDNKSPEWNEQLSKYLVKYANVFAKKRIKINFPSMKSIEIFIGNL